MGVDRTRGVPGLGRQWPRNGPLAPGRRRLDGSVAGRIAHFGRRYSCRSMCDRCSHGNGVVAVSQGLWERVSLEMAVPGRFLRVSQPGEANHDPVTDKVANL